MFNFLAVSLENFDCDESVLPLFNVAKFVIRIIQIAQFNILHIWVLVVCMLLT